VKKTIVTPGELVAYAEEFETKGAVLAVDHKYHASALSVATYDEKSHVAVVKPVRGSAYPQPGAVVYCQVTGKGRRAYQLRCFAVEEGKNAADLKYPVSGVLPYFFSDGDIGIGDYLRAKVVSTYGPPIVVSIRGPTYGVILSRCPKCGAVLKRRGMMLYCPNCGAEVKRKIAVGHYAT